VRAASPYMLRGQGLRIPAGTLATPALRFGREKTGIYRAGAGRLAIGVGGFRAFEITANDLFVRSNNTGNVQPLSIARANATTADGQETSVDFYEIASVVGRMSLYRQASTIMGFKWYGYNSGLHGTPAMTLSGDKDLTVGRDLIVVRNIAAAAIGASAGLTVSAGAVSLPSGSIAAAANGVQPAARVSSNAIQSIPSGAFTSVLMQVESEDTGTFHSTVTNTSRIVLGVSGLWLVIGAGILNSNGAATTAYRILGIRVDGAGTIYGSGIYQATGSNSDHDASLLVRSNGSTYVELSAYQLSGVATDLASGAILQAVWLGP
jgi:hypothetical protein